MSSLSKEMGGKLQESQKRITSVCDKARHSDRTKSSITSGLQMILCGQDSVYSECLCVATLVHVSAWVFICPLCIQEHVHVGDNVYLCMRKCRSY